jgi:Fe-S cluster biogenesis protein NfuA
MGLFATIKRALGFDQDRLVVSDPHPVSLSEAGSARVDALPPGEVLRVATAPVPDGYIVHVEEGAADDVDEVPAQGFVGSPVDLERMRGLQLDWDGDRWRVLMHLDVRAGKTPNPDGRLYQTSRPLAIGRPRYFVRGVSMPVLPRSLLEIDGVESVLLRNNAVTIGRVSSVSWDDLDQQVDAALRQYFLLCGQALPSEPLAALDGPLEQAVTELLARDVLPGVHQDGGDIELVDIVDGVVRVHMRGACVSCPAAEFTLKLGVEKALKAAFGERIARVEAV